MENATQALLIVGGILLAILILSIGVIIYNSHSNTADAITTRWSTVELNKYNSTFQIYEGRTDVTAQEIVSLISLSQQREGAISIMISCITLLAVVKTKTGTIIGNNNVTAWDKSKMTQFLSDHIVTTVKKPAGTTKQNTFSYVTDSIRYDEDGKICEIAFKEN